MKHSFKPAMLPWLTLLAGGAGLLLRLWLYATGVDDGGLLTEGHPAELFIWLLTACVLVGLWLATQSLVAAPKYPFNFPHSLYGTIGCALAALAIGFASVTEILSRGDNLAMIAAVVGLLAAAALAVLAFLRFKGIQPNILLHAIFLYMM